LQAARKRGSIPEVEPAPAIPLDASREDVQAAAMAYVMRHFKGYGYKAEDVSGQDLGYHIEVSNAKGATLLKVAVKGTSAGMSQFQLTSEERASSVREPLWRLLVVADVFTPTAQHTIYKPSEMEQAPGFEAPPG
jgi:hypothetical protein